MDPNGKQQPTIDLFTHHEQHNVDSSGNLILETFGIKHSASYWKKNPLQTVPRLLNFMIYVLYEKVYYGLACKILMYLLKN